MYELRNLYKRYFFADKNTKKVTQIYYRHSMVLING